MLLKKERQDILAHRRYVYILAERRWVLSTNIIKFHKKKCFYDKFVSEMAFLTAFFYAGKHESSFGEQTQVLISDARLLTTWLNFHDNRDTCITNQMKHYRDTTLAFYAHADNICLRLCFARNIFEKFRVKS